MCVLTNEYKRAMFVLYFDDALVISFVCAAIAMIDDFSTDLIKIF